MAASNQVNWQRFDSTASETGAAAQAAAAAVAATTSGSGGFAAPPGFGPNGLIMSTTPLTGVAHYIDAFQTLQFSEEAPIPSYAIQSTMFGRHGNRSASREKRPAGRRTVGFAQEVVDTSHKKASAEASVSVDGEGPSGGTAKLCKKSRQVLTALLVDPSLLSDPATVQDYFAVKSLVEYLPERSFIPTGIDRNLQLGAVGGNNGGSGGPRSFGFGTGSGGSATGSSPGSGGGLSPGQDRPSFRKHNSMAAIKRTVLSRYMAETAAHHYASRHGFQLYLRMLQLEVDSADATVEEALVEAKRVSRASKIGYDPKATSPTQSLLLSSKKKDSGKSGSKQQEQESRAKIVPNVSSLVRQASASLPPPISCDRLAGMRSKVIATAEQVSGQPPRVVPRLQLQCHGFHRDRDLLMDHREQMQQARLRQQFRALANMTPESNSLGRMNSFGGTSHEELESLDSISVSSRSSKSTSRSTKLNKRMSKLGYIPSLKEEYWISLKGIIFRINFETESPGRNLYYKSLLAPLHSGKECTHLFVAAMGSFDINDFPFLVAERDGHNEVKAANENNDDAVGDHRLGDELKKEKQPTKYVGGSAIVLSAEARRHINAIFCVFLHDFDVIGEVEGCEDLWF